MQVSPVETVASEAAAQPEALEVDTNPLDAFLQTQLEQASHESSGRFTLDTNLALEKFIDSQFERPSIWILKVVQAAVALRASQIEVRQDRRATAFHMIFVDLPLCSLKDFESGFGELGESASPPFNFLKRALWEVGLRQKRPFVLIFPESTQALVWSGKKLTLESCPISSKLELIVGHPEAGPCRDEEREARERAYVCPVPLSWNGNRLDRLENSPTHGCEALRCILAIGGVEGTTTLPRLSVPRGTLEKQKLPPACPIQPEIHYLNIESDSVRAYYSLSFELENLWEGPSRLVKPRLASRPSLLVWCHSGVVLECEELEDWREPALTCALFVSAEGLPLDATGQKIQRQDDWRERKDIFSKAWIRQTNRLQVSLDRARELAQDRANSNLAVMVLLPVFFLSFVMMAISPFFGVGCLVLGLLVVLHLMKPSEKYSRQVKELETQLTQALQRLSLPEQASDEWKPGKPPV